MEQIGTLLKKASESLNTHSQATAGNLPCLKDGRSIRQIDDESFAVTLYKGKPATDVEIAQFSTKVQSLFPMMNPATVGEIFSTIVKEGWTAQHISEAIEHVKKNCDYPTFPPAKMLSFDRIKKLYNYRGYCAHIDAGGKHEDFGFIKISHNGQELPFWYLLNEQLSIC